MKATISQRALGIEPSITLTLSAQAKQMKADGIAVLDFSAGEPDFDTPAPIRQAAVAALDSGFTRYTAAGGIPELKEAIGRKYEREQNLSYGADEILVSNGGKHALHNLFQALLDPGDEVLIPAPYWVSYPDMVRLSGGKAVILETSLADGYKVDPGDLERAIGPQTKALILNSPSNPTGAVYTAEELRALAAVVEPAGILVISDDVYEKFVFDGRTFTNLLHVAPGLKERVMIVNSASKTFAMPGWRMGFAAGPAEIIRAATRIQGQATSCPGSISQKAYAFALNAGPEMVEEFRRSYEIRRDLITDGITAIEGVRAVRPQGAFYLFADVGDLYGRVENVTGSTDFCDFLLRELQIACIPGQAFGDDRCIRFSFVTDEASIREAIARLRARFG